MSSNVNDNAGGGKRGPRVERFGQRNVSGMLIKRPDGTVAADGRRVVLDQDVPQTQPAYSEEPKDAQ